MKRFLLVLAATSISTQTMALSSSQIDNTYRSLCQSILINEDDNGYTHYTSCNDEHQDEVIAVGELIGSSDVETLASPVTVISTYDLENRNQTYLGDILRSVPGVSVNRSGPGGALTQIRLRGSEASHVLVLVDGVEVANPAAGEFDLSGIRGADILKIEVLRGEQSALYGSDAIGGVINITTKSREAIHGWDASMEAGSFGTFDGQFNGTVPLGELATVSIGVGGGSTSGYDISGLGGEKDGSDNFKLSLGLSALEVGGVNLSAQYTDNHLKTGFDEDLFFSGRLDDTDSTTIVDTKTARIDARFSVAYFDNQITLSGHDITSDSQASFPSKSNGTRRQAQWVIEKEVLDDHTLTVLGEIEEESYNISPSFAFEPTRPENTNYALAADYRFNPFDTEISITASARNDFNDRFGDSLTWKLGGTFGHTWDAKHDGRVRVNVGTGVKNPSLIELFGFYPESNFVGNPNLKPEESFGYGIGYSHDYNANWFFTVDYFKSELTDEIFTDFSSFPFLARNRDTDSKREGVELSAKWVPSENTMVYGSATFLDTEENGVKELRRPNFQASATATVTPMKDVRLTGSIDHTGSQVDTDFSTFSPVELDPFTLVGLNAAFDVSDNVTLTLRGENLLDEEYEEVVGYRSQGRGVYGGLRLRFD